MRPRLSGRTPPPARSIPSDRKFNAHPKLNNLEVRDYIFRANAMWLAREWGYVGNSLHSRPYSNPTDIRKWLRDKQRARARLRFLGDRGHLS